MSRLRFRASRSAGEVSALVTRPKEARWMLVLAHGAGAGMDHPFMESLAASLAARGVASFRYQFPYSERGSRRPDPAPLLEATVRSAFEAAAAFAGELPLIAGGKSMGGRMTSRAAAREPLDGLRGIVFFGFPLHAIGKPGTERADHLNDVAVPLFFLQGSRDRLADLGLLEPVIARLGVRATIHVVDDADHSFHVPARSGRSDADVLDELSDETAGWAAEL
ncbi:MAG TPA: alpha/beta family hydrolase [Gemmatimonadota bacterium]|nr:alpha/beta family hydrolase [Gemmatimonadota bacterium]